MKALFKIVVGLILLLFIAALYKEISFGHTTHFTDARGDIIPGSVARLEQVELEGMEQWILIRGTDTRNPVLLWLHGGPGAAQMPLARHFNGELEDDFIVVHWDQRGAGKSNPPGFDETTMYLERYVADTLELTLYLKELLQKDKIYLLGHSWGSQLGLRVVEEAPHLYHAYIGVSQWVDPLSSQNVPDAGLFAVAITYELTGRLSLIWLVAA